MKKTQCVSTWGIVWDDENGPWASPRTFSHQIDAELFLRMDGSPGRVTEVVVMLASQARKLGVKVPSI